MLTPPPVSVYWNQQRSPREIASLRRRARVSAMLRPRAFFQVRAFCLFVGYPRSGHSLVGSIIDAHRHAVMAHELDAVRLVQAGFTRSELFHSILGNCRAFSRIERKWTGYDYTVANQSQGRSDVAYLVGDKKGGASTRALADDPEVLARLRRTVGVPLRLIHVIRDPYDNIASISRRHPLPLDAAAGRYFELSRAVLKFKHILGAGEMLDLYLEDLIADSSTQLHRLCDFLGLMPDPSYVRDCASVILPMPRRARETVEWTSAIHQAIGAHVAATPFLARYAAGEAVP